MSWEKSFLFTGSNVTRRRREQLRHKSQMCMGSLPFNYLRVPLFVGVPKRKWLQPVADRILGQNLENGKGILFPRLDVWY